jgi:hypothetical protein
MKFALLFIQGPEECLNISHATCRALSCLTSEIAPGDFVELANECQMADRVGTTRWQEGATGICCAHLMDSGRLPRRFRES